MFIIIFILVVAIVVADFLMIKKENWKQIAVYLSIVAISALVYTVNKMALLNTSPLEMFIKKMEPLTMWLENIFK